jgi:hypothetical protein
MLLHRNPRPIAVREDELHGVLRTHWGARHLCRVPSRTARRGEPPLDVPWVRGAAALVPALPRPTRSGMSPARTPARRRRLTKPQRARADRVARRARAAVEAALGTRLSFAPPPYYGGEQRR